MFQFYISQNFDWENISGRDVECDDSECGSTSENMRRHHNSSSHHNDTNHRNGDFAASAINRDHFADYQPDKMLVIDANQKFFSSAK